VNTSFMVMSDFNPNNSQIYLKWILGDESEKRSQKFVWKLPDGICSRSPKINRIDWGQNHSLIQEEKSLSWTGRVEVGSQTFRGRRQVTEFFFRTNRFSSIKRPNSSRKSIKKVFWKLRNQYFILTSFIESKNRQIEKKTMTFR
jgi:hypothetical protein